MVAKFKANKNEIKEQPIKVALLFFVLKLEDGLE